MASKPRKVAKPSVRQVALAKGFSSGFEDSTSADLDAQKITYTYEQHKVTYLVPARPAKYTPDYVFPNGVVVELKGRFVTADRQKHILIKNQTPGLDIRFVFSNSRTRISKQSKTTYAAWCDTHGFLYADKFIPLAWINEATTAERTEAAQKYLIHTGHKKAINKGTAQ